MSNDFAPWTSTDADSIKAGDTVYVIEKRQKPGARYGVTIPVAILSVVEKITPTKVTTRRLVNGEAQGPQTVFRRSFGSEIAVGSVHKNLADMVPVTDANRAVAAKTNSAYSALVRHQKDVKAICEFFGNETKVGDLSAAQIASVLSIINGAS